MRSDVLAHFPDARQAGAGWAARCPAHDDHRASLSIGRGDDDRWLLHCHAGCALDAILPAANLTTADLMPPTTGSKARIVATYSYHDEAGVHLYDVVRFNPKDFRQRRADGKWSMQGVRRVLYHLHGIQGQMVAYVPEGERDVDRLRALGLAATCNVGGAGKWRREYAAQLKGAGVENIVILPDNDDPGRKHGEDVARSCHAAGLRAKVVHLPDLPSKGDVSDWLDAGGTRDQLLEIVKATAVYAPTALPAADSSNTRPAPGVYGRPAVTIAAGDSVLAPLPDEPYSSWFNRGALHIAAGSSGAGKTTLMVDLLRRQRRGEMFLGHVGRRHDYLVIFADRGAVSNRETFARMGIDPATCPVAHIHGVPHGPTSMTGIITAIEAQEELPAVVFVEGADMLVEDASKPAIVTAFLDGLLRLAEHYGLAVILSVGAGKARPTEQYALQRDRVFGSIMWTRRADTVCVLSIDGDGTTPRRHLAVLHRNAAAETFTLEYRDGLLVPTEPVATDEGDYVGWFRQEERFTKNAFRKAFRLSGQRTVELLDGYVKVGTLRTRTRDDRTVYVYRADTVSTIHPKVDGNSAGDRDPKVVHFSSGRGQIPEGEISENPNVFPAEGPNPLIPPFSLSTDHFLSDHAAEVDSGHVIAPSPRACERDETNHDTEGTHGDDLDAF